MQVHVVATEEEGRLVPEGNSLAVAALSEVQLRVLVGLKVGSAHLSVLVPLRELLGHDALVHDAVVVELSGADLILGHFLACDKGREGSKGERVLHDDVQVVLACDQQSRVVTAQEERERGREQKSMAASTTADADFLS